MSMKWPGGLIRKTPVTPAGPLQNGTAPGMWSLAEASYWTKQGLWPIAGNEQLVVEDVFSTYLYTGNGSTQTITNGIDLAGKGGMVWIKARTSSSANSLTDTVRGLSNALRSNGANESVDSADGVTGALSNGFTLGSGSNGWTNSNADTYASWTFREAPKFFDVVTYTGTGANRNIAHNLGSVPGMIIVKRTDTTGDWQVYHVSLGNTQYMVLNTSTAPVTSATRWNNTTPTATEFTVGTDATVNASGGTYVAYLFAHDAASDGIIQCGKYSGNSLNSGPTINLGWEPQWLMIKRVGATTANWHIIDNMRGMPVDTADAVVRANLSNAEESIKYVGPTSTGFQLTTGDGAVNASGVDYLYIAIRRGPMRTPTLGTSVFMPISRTGTGSSTFVSTSGFPSDNYFVKRTDGGGSSAPGFYFDRLRGGSSGGYGMSPTSTAAENSIYQVLGFNAPNNNGVRVGNVNNYYDTSGLPYVDYHFRRAPSFFDVVCYTGNGGSAPFNHNLGVAPELIITKCRNSSSSWNVGTQFSPTGHLLLELSAVGAAFAASYNTALYFGAQPTATQFYPGNASGSGASGSTYVAYLFASCAGVSKVGSYTGNGSSQTINCAFTTGARFVLIKRTDSTGDWLVWDSARGIVAGNDPYLALNTTAAEVTTNDSVDTDNTGFIVNQVAASNVNVNGGTYLFLAIA